MLPSSVAIIPDGNRRFSRKAGVSIQSAYLAGFKKVEEVAGWAGEVGVSSLSFWALSLENFFKRSKNELSIIFSLFDRKLGEAISDNRFNEEGVRVKFFGKLDLLPKTLQERMRLLEKRTQDNKRIELNIAVAYAGKEELLHAARAIALDVSLGRISREDINEESFEKYLYFTRSPDLVIRTGDVQRLSGFMPWQAGYSELFFSKKLWPEFQRTDFNEALDYYAGVKRNFGK